MPLRRRTLLKALPGLVALPAGTAAQAQARYPTKPITIVVSSPPGGQSDSISRYLGNAVGQELGQPFVIENRAGANGIIGLQYAARRPADGYTLAYGVGSWMAINPGFYPNLPYDPEKDFTAVTQIGITPQALMVSTALPAKTLAEFIALAKARPGQLTYASFGNGSSSHLQAEMLKMTAGIDMVHVPFKGSAPALQEVLAGRVDCFIIDFAPAAPFIKEGRIRALALTGTERFSDFPDVPTFKELGYPLTLVGWNGLFAPAGTPKDIVALLNSKFNAVIRSPEGQAKLRQLGAVPTGTTPEEYQHILHDDIGKWREVIRRSGAKPD